MDNSSLAHINYVIAYYVRLFLIPINGELIALKFIDEAIGMENDISNLNIINTAIEKKEIALKNNVSDMFLRDINIAIFLERVLETLL